MRKQPKTTFADVPDRPLNSRQQRALSLMIAGQTDAEIARQIHITRQTVNQWRNHDVCFQKELGKRREELISQRRDQLAVAAGRAMQKLLDHMESDDAHISVRSATALLRLSGIQAYTVRELREAEPDWGHTLAALLRQARAKLGYGDDIDPDEIDPEAFTQKPPPMVSFGPPGS